MLVARPAAPVPAGEVQALPRSLLLQLPAGDGELSRASLLPLDQAHIAVVGVPHPSAGPGKGTRLAPRIDQSDLNPRVASSDRIPDD